MNVVSDCPPYSNSTWRCVRQAIFAKDASHADQLNESNKRKFREWQQKMIPILEKHDKVVYSNLASKDDAWWNANCARYISSDRLAIWQKLERIIERYREACIGMFSTCTDADGAERLRIEIIHETVRTLLAEDRLSDPENQDMYFYLGDDKYGVPKYITVRGTTQVDGSV